MDHFFDHLQRLPRVGSGSGPGAENTRRGNDGEEFLDAGDAAFGRAVPEGRDVRQCQIGDVRRGQFGMPHREQFGAGRIEDFVGPRALTDHQPPARHVQQSLKHPQPRFGFDGVPLSEVRDRSLGKDLSLNARQQAIDLVRHPELLEVPQALPNRKVDEREPRLVAFEPDQTGELIHDLLDEFDLPVLCGQNEGAVDEFAANLRDLAERWRIPDGNAVRTQRLRHEVQEFERELFPHARSQRQTLVEHPATPLLGRFIRQALLVVPPNAIAEFLRLRDVGHAKQIDFPRVLGLH